MFLNIKTSKGEKIMFFLILLKIIVGIVIVIYAITWLVVIIPIGMVAGGIVLMITGTLLEGFLGFLLTIAGGLLWPVFFSKGGIFGKGGGKESKKKGSGTPSIPKKAPAKA